MAIAFKEVTSSSTAAEQNSLILNVPASTAVGDVLIVHHVFADALQPVIGPDGWTQLRNDTSGNSSAGVRSSIWYRIATGSELASYEWSSPSYRVQAGQMLCYSGVDVTTPFDVHDATIYDQYSVVTTTTTPTSPALYTLYEAGYFVWLAAPNGLIASDTMSMPVDTVERARANSSSLIETNVGSQSGEKALSTYGDIAPKEGVWSPSVPGIVQAFVLAPADEIPNHPPISNAGPDQSVFVNTLVTLDGSGSTDGDIGDTPLTFAWAQISGPNAPLQNSTTLSPSFTPIVTGSYVYGLTVTDQRGKPSQVADTVTIFVSPVGTYIVINKGVSVFAEVRMPTNVPIGSLAIAVVTCTANYYTTGTAPAGWIGVRETASSTVITGSRNIVYYRIIDGTEAASYSWTLNSVSASWATQCIVVSGTHTIHPITDSQAGVTLASTTISTLPIAKPVPYTTGMLLFITAMNTGQATPGQVITPPNNMVLVTQEFEPSDYLLCYSAIQTAVSGSIGSVAATASASGNSATNILLLRPSNQNATPVADAGADANVFCGDTAHLSGGASIDFDGDAITSYTWSQLSGPLVTLSDATDPNPSFAAPLRPTVLTFQLTVSDISGATSTDTVEITVIRRQQIKVRLGGSWSIKSIYTYKNNSWQ